MGDTAAEDAAAAAKKRAGELKDAGNAALAKGAKGRALALYTEGLALDPTSHVLLSNRSGVNLELGQAGDAEADARAAIAAAPEWPKSHFRLGAALEAQGRHAEAAEAYADALAADPANADMARCRDRAIKAAEVEAAKGGAGSGSGLVGRRPTHREALAAAQAVVDPAALPKVPRVEDLLASRHGSSLRLGAAPGRGRFLVASRPVKAYELLAAEPALFWAPPRVNDVGPMAPALWETGPDVRGHDNGAALLDAYLLQLAPFHAVAVERAAGGEAPPDPARPETGLPPLTRGELALRALAHNAHGICWAESGVHQDARYLPTLGVTASLANHSCEPTAAVDGVWDSKAGCVVLRLFSLVDIPEGGEVTISYAPSRLPRDLRVTQLAGRYGFTCACRRCTAPVEDGVTFKCPACYGTPDGKGGLKRGRVFLGGAACVDCGAAVPANSSGPTTNPPASYPPGSPAAGLTPLTTGLASSLNGDWDKLRKAWLARASSRSLEDTLAGGEEGAGSGSSGGSACPLHLCDLARLQTAVAQLPTSMALDAGTAAAQAALLRDGVLAQPRYGAAEGAGLLLNCGHLLALGGRAEEAKQCYTTAAARYEAEYGASHPSTQIARGLITKPPASASELGKIEGRRREAGVWPEACGLPKKAAQRWLDPVAWERDPQRMPDGRTSFSPVDMAPLQRLRQAQVAMLAGPYTPGRDVWADADGARITPPAKAVVQAEAAKKAAAEKASGGKGAKK